MLKKFFPHAYAPDVYAIDYEYLYEQGYQALIFDIDQTLVQHGEQSTKEVDELFKRIHAIGFKTILLSNNSAERIEEFIENIDTLYVAMADKPQIDGYLKALDMLGTSKEKTVFIGDQIFTDILGANRCGIPSILVRFLRHDYETKIGKKRQVERLVLACYRLSRTYQNRLGNVVKEIN